MRLDYKGTVRELAAKEVAGSPDITALLSSTPAELDARIGSLQTLPQIRAVLKQLILIVRSRG